MSATPDFQIQKRILETLCALEGRALNEQILIDEVAMRLPARTDAQAIRDQLAIMSRTELIAHENGPLRDTRWRRTPAGAAALKDLEG